VAIVAALVLGLLAFTAGRMSRDSSSASTPLAPVTVQSVTTAPAPLTGREVEPAAAVARTLGPAVVQIETGSGLGSGFVYDADGRILTAAHVVNGSTQVRVRLADGRRVPARVLGADPSTDVAVLKIDGVKNLAVAVLATGVKVEVGQTAIAIGSPFGLDRTVTAGIVSAVGRSVETSSKSAVPMVQTDAPINPGNSGGALADRRGRVIGINDSIAGGSGGNVGVGFAVPIDIAKSVADRILAGKSLAAGYLGVEGTDAQGSRSGAVVTNVSGGSPASKAGLRADDVVVEVDGTPIDSMVDLAARVRSREPGQQVRLTVLRGSDQRQVTVTLGKASS
jgi:putative serine protease PepD